MSRIIFGSIADARPGDTDFVEGCSVQGAVSTWSVVDGLDRPILLHKHALKEGGVLEYSRAPVGHVLYVLNGAAQVDGQTIGPGGAIAIEHGADVRITVDVDELVLLDFHARDTHHETRSGGNIHLVPPPGPEGEDVASGTRHAMFVDSGCPTCTLWLDYLEFRPGYRAGLHWHTEDEIIVVVGGELRVGTRRVGPGGFAAIDEGARYSFTAGDDGLAFINFRPSDPAYIPVRKGENPPAMLERELLNKLPAPRDPNWRVPAPGVLSFAGAAVSEGR